MTREWIALERHEGRAHDLSLYARALHAQLHRWVDGDGRIEARLEGDLCESMAKSIAFRFGATRGDRRLIAGHLGELASVGAVLLSAAGLELRALADGADLVRHKLAIGDRPAPTKRLKLTVGAGEQRTVTIGDEAATNGHDRSRTSNEASRPETKDDTSARNNNVHSPRVEESRREERREEQTEKSACVPHAAPSEKTRSDNTLAEPIRQLPLAASAAAVETGHQPSQGGERSTMIVETGARPSVDSSASAGALSLDSSATPKRRAQRRTPRAPAVDPVPPVGTVARRVYEAITTDVALGPRVTGPGDLSIRLAAICDGTSVDPAREVIQLGAWLLRKPEGHWKDAAAGLLRNISSKVNDARALPVASPAVTGPKRDVSKGPLKSAELDQFNEDYAPDFSEPQGRIGGVR
jgi:hypothetical protein